MSEWYDPDTNKLLKDLEDQCTTLSRTAKVKSYLYNFVSVCSIFLIVVMSSAIGILGLQALSSPTISYVMSALGFTITAIKTLDSTFGTEKNAVVNRNVSDRVNRIHREVSKTKIVKYDEGKLLELVEGWHDELDELDLSVFSDEFNLKSRIPWSSGAKKNPEEGDGS